MIKMITLLTNQPIQSIRQVTLCKKKNVRLLKNKKKMMMKKMKNKTHTLSLRMIGFYEDNHNPQQQDEGSNDVTDNLPPPPSYNEVLQLDIIE
eukprot:UN08976